MSEKEKTEQQKILESIWLQHLHHYPQGVGLEHLYSLELLVEAIIVYLLKVE